MSSPPRSRILVFCAVCVGAACSIPPSPIVTPVPPPSAGTAVFPMPSAPAASVITTTVPLEKPTGRVATKLPGVLDPDANTDRPEASCDYERPFRGVIGKGTHVSLRVHRDHDGKLAGKVHYDVPGPGLEVTGEVKPDGSFSLKEKGGGTFTGTCATGVGSLTGLYTKDQPFELLPRPMGEPPMYLSVTIDHDAHSVCDLRGELPQVFGLTHPEAEKSANDALGPATRAWASADTHARVQRCADAASGRSRVWGTYSLAFADKDAVGVLLSSGESGLGSSLGPKETVNVDLATGRRLDFADVITNEAHFREIVRGCLPTYRLALPAYQTGDDDFAAHFAWTKPTLPLWILVPGGVALLSEFESKAESELSGSGPVITWDVLLREGVLRADSPVKRLWEHTDAARPEVAACTQVYWRSALWAPLKPGQEAN